MSRTLVRLAGALAILAGAASASAQVLDWPKQSPPGPLPARDIKFPPYEVRTLANGLQVIAVVHHEQPAVSLRLLVRAGGAQDPNGKPGVASVAASLLDQGTTTKTAEQIALTVDSNGGAIGAGAGTDLTFINAAFMKDGFPRPRPRRRSVRNPAFAPEEIERQRQQIASGLQGELRRPGAWPAGVRSPRLRPPSVRQAEFRDGRLHRGDYPGRPARAPQAVVRRQQRHPRRRRRRDAGGRSPGPARVRGWGRVDLSSAAGRSAAAADPPRRHHRSARLGADRDPRRQLRPPRKSPDYLALDIAGKISAAKAQPPAPRAAPERGLTYGASADVNASGERRHRR